MMDNYIKLCAGVLLTAILCLSVAKHEKDITLLIVLAACCMIVSAAAIYLQPILQFVKRLCQTADLDTDFVSVLFKAVGIGLVSEITSMICIDAGNQALAKALQIVSSVVILWISIPMLERFITMIEEILAGL